MELTLLICFIGLGLIVFIGYKYSIALEERDFLNRLIDDRTSFYKKRLEEIHTRIDELHDGMKGVVPIKYMKDISKELEVLKKAIKAIK